MREGEGEGERKRGEGEGEGGGEGKVRRVRKGEGGIEGDKELAHQKEHSGCRCFSGEFHQHSLFEKYSTRPKQGPFIVLQ